MKNLALFAGVSAITFSFVSGASAKTPGHEYCFYDTCHRVKTLDETRRLVGVTTTLKASFYDDARRDRYNPSNITSSGEYFRADRPDNAASPIYPDGTKLLVWYGPTRRAVVVRVNSAGPYWGDRKLDLSRAAAEKLGFGGRGVGTVSVRVLAAPSKAEATYRKGRVYPSVPGYLGQFANVEMAYARTGEGAIRLAAASAIKPSFVAPAQASVVAAAADAAPVDAAPLVQAATAVTQTAAPVAPTPVVVAAAAPVATPASAPASTHRAVAPTLLDLKLASSVEAEARRFLAGPHLTKVAMR